MKKNMKRLEMVYVLYRLLDCSPLSNREISEKFSQIKTIQKIIYKFHKAGMVERTEKGLWYIPQKIREELQKLR